MKGYLPELDGLRALAVLVVVGVHTGVPAFAGGAIGVDVFFVLSGYLITRLLRESHPTLREFYMRRFWRLTPPLALMLAVYVVVYSILVPGYPHWRDALLSLFYLTDYSRAFWHLPTYVAHTWSLSVEEHFYLLWPLILMRLNPSVKSLVVAYAVATIWRWLPWQEAAYLRFDTRTAPLLLGCIIASVPRGRFPAWPALLMLAGGTALDPWQLDGVAGAGAVMAVELAAAVAILGKAPRWLSHRWMAYLGKLSYGIYLWHALISVYLVDVLLVSWREALLYTLPGSIALAAISYHTIEAWARSGPLRGTVQNQSSQPINPLTG